MPNWHLEAITPQDLDKILTIDRSAFKRPGHRKSFSEELDCNNATSYAVKEQSANYSMEIIASIFLRNQHPQTGEDAMDQLKESL